jgi:hypothetical protein
VTKPHALDGCREKVKRAKEQVENLNTEISAIENGGIYTAVGNHEFERQRYVFHSVGPRVDLRISVLTGEIVHHLWSVFDHIIWQLATTSGLRYQQMITFPVKDSLEEFEKTVKNGNIQGVPAAAISLIESFQPYRTSDPPNSVTRILYDLDRAEKHRLLIATTKAMWPGNEIRVVGDSESDVAINLATPPEAGPFHRGVEDGVEILWLSYTATTRGRRPRDAKRDLLHYCQRRRLEGGNHPHYDHAPNPSKGNAPPVVHYAA